MNKLSQAGEAPGEQELMLRLLDAVHRDETLTQRRAAAHLSVAVGLVNAYFKRCVTKGYIKVCEAPKRRYAYYLTPQGFAAKARLTSTYLTHSLSFFRNARLQCRDILAECHRHGWNRLVLAGGGDLAEIMALCAREFPVDLLGIVDAAESGAGGLPVASDMAGFKSAQAVLVTDMTDPQRVFDDLCEVFPPERVLAPAVLCIVRTPPVSKGG